MDQPQWTADIDIGQGLAQRVIAEQFPALASAVVQPFGSGWDNAAFLVGGRIVFRFPRRRVAAHLIEREISILPHIAPYLPLAIPVPRYVGGATTSYPWSFAGYDLIGGTTACRVLRSDPPRSALAEPLANFLRALHDVAVQPLIARGLPSDEIGRLDHEKRLSLTRKRLPPLLASDLGDEALRYVSWLETHPPGALADARRTLVHGDLYARHVLLGDRGRPTGIIDWGDVHLGDPALDIAIAFLVLPQSAHAAFRAAYGAIDDRTWNAARYRAIYHALLEVEYGMREDDEGMRSMGSAALRLLG